MALARQAAPAGWPTDVVQCEPYYNSTISFTDIGTSDGLYALLDNVFVIIAE